MKPLIETLEQEIATADVKPGDIGYESPGEYFEDWSASREQTNFEEKVLMAKFFTRHHLLVREGEGPESKRETVASILVMHGTTANCIVKESLQWIVHNKEKGPFFLTWYTPGHLVPSTLQDIRQIRDLRTALKLFLFPGEVDEETQSVLGRDAELFAENLQRHFTYAFLSAYSFDLSTGDVYFYFPRELRLQRACATRFADHKFLFLDSSKFKSSGERAFGITDMLKTSYAVTLYTVSSERDEWIINRFHKLCGTILKTSPSSSTDHFDLKTLRLQIVGRDESSTRCVQKSGVLAVRGKH